MRKKNLLLAVHFLLLMLSCQVLFQTPSFAIGDSLCAQVKIEVRQELTLERQAFDAHMRINNGLTHIPLENVNVQVTFSDEEGTPVLASYDPAETEALFFIRLDTMDNIDSVDGNGAVQPSTSADIHWLIIPAPGASNGLEQGTLYYVGAILTYTIGGEEYVMQVSPDYIFVKPMPELTLDYFLPSDVYGDDAFTPEIEPSIPFYLGVRVKNAGHGVARNLKIDSAQPKIVDNEQGLLINFIIEGCQIDDQDAAKSLLADFGNISANGSRVARWIMSCSLSGKFIAFDADFSHSDELGGELTSLIESVHAHLFMHDVLVDVAGRDHIRDFLAKEAGGYMVYESEGMDAEVTDRSAFATLEFESQSGGEALYTLTVPVTDGFMYVQLPDPHQGTKMIKEIVRSDGKRIKEENAWFSKTRDEDMNWDHFINLFDVNTTGSYSVMFGDPEEAHHPPVLQFIPDRTGIETRQISFIVEASDPDGTVPSLNADPLAVGAHFTDQGDGTAVFDWTPAEGQAGRYEITFTASDGVLEDSQVAVLTVYAIDTIPPNIWGIRAITTDSGVTITWETDKPCDSRIVYGPAMPPDLEVYDPALITSHTITINGLTPNTYCFQATCTDIVGNEVTDDNEGSYHWFTVIGILSGWPQGTGDVVKSSPLAVDLDNDGAREVVAASSDGLVYAWHADGSIVSGWPQDTGASGIESSSAAADIDGDGILEIVIGTDDGDVYAWHANGDLVAGWPQGTGDKVRASATLINLDGQRGLEVVVGSYDCYVYAWHSDGTMVSGWPQGTGASIFSSPAVADIDQDGSPEVVIGSQDGSVYAWHADGTIVSGWPQGTGAMVNSSPALADLDGDGSLEIIAGSDDGNVYAWHADGTAVSGWPQSTTAAVFCSPAIGDLDKDGDPEIVVGDGNGYLYAWHADGIPVAGWPQKPGADLFSSPAIWDTDGDGAPEIIIGSDDGRVYTYRADGTLVSMWPTAGNRIHSSPALVDIDADSDVEVLIGAGNYVYVWDCHGVFDAAFPGWSMFRHDINHTGFYGDSTCLVDTLPPEVICRDITIALDASGNASIAPEDVNDGSWDECGIAGIAVSPDSFTCANVGDNTVTLSVTDNNGNIGTCTAAVMVEDTILPVARCKGITVQLDAGGNASIVPGDVDDGSWDECGISSLTVSPDSFTSTNVGDNSVMLTVTDNSGNTNTCTATVVVEDTVPPEARCKDITLQLDAGGNASIVPGDMDDGSWDACGIGSLVVAPDSFNCANTGDNTVTLTVTDVNGNSSSCQATVTVEDNTPPVARCKNITVQLDAGGNASIVPEDVDDGSWDQCGIAGLAVSPDSFTCADVGDNSVTLTVTDTSGNTSTCAATVTVEDNVAPVALCKDITVQLDTSGNASITAGNIDDGSWDACGIAGLAVSTSVFTCADIGANTVTLTVTDRNGNVSYCQATVTIEDKVSPTARCKDIAIQLDEGGSASITSADVDNGSWDACGIADLAVSPDSFNCSSIGENAVTLTVTDNNGNTSVCQATVTVTDDVAPVARCKEITVQLDESGNASITPGDVNNGSWDACGIAGMTVSRNSFGCADVGENSVTLAVTDSHGNVSSCQAIVTVEDTVPPKARCKDVTVNLDEAGNASITPADVDNGSWDACGIAGLDVSPESFNCASIGENAVTLKVTDNHGNVSTCQATVTVRDVSPPDIRITGIAGDQDGLSENEYWITSPVVISYEVSDSCDSNPYVEAAPEYVYLDTDTQTIVIFPYSISGEVEVYIKVTDSSGNSESISTTIIITGGMPDVDIEELSTNETGYFPNSKAHITVRGENNTPFAVNDLVLLTSMISPDNTAVFHAEETIPELESGKKLKYAYTYFIPEDAAPGTYVLRAVAMHTYGVIFDEQVALFVVGLPAISKFEIGKGRKKHPVRSKDELPFMTRIRNYDPTNTYTIDRTVTLFGADGTIKDQASQPGIVLFPGEKLKSNVDLSADDLLPGPYQAEMLITDSTTGQIYDSEVIHFFVTNARIIQITTSEEKRHKDKTFPHDKGIVSSLANGHILLINASDGKDFNIHSYVPDHEVMITVWSIREYREEDLLDISVSVTVRDPQGRIVHEYTEPLDPPGDGKRKPRILKTQTGFTLPSDALLGRYSICTSLIQKDGTLLDQENASFGVRGKLEIEDFKTESKDFRKFRSSSKGKTVEEVTVTNSLSLSNHDSADHTATVRIWVENPSGDTVSEESLDVTVKSGSKKMIPGIKLVVSEPESGEYMVKAVVKDETGKVWDKKENSLEIIR